MMYVDCCLTSSSAWVSSGHFRFIHQLPGETVKRTTRLNMARIMTLRVFHLMESCHFESLDCVGLIVCGVLETRMHQSSMVGDTYVFLLLLATSSGVIPSSFFTFSAPCPSEVSTWATYIVYNSYFYGK